MGVQVEVVVVVVVVARGIQREVEVVVVVVVDHHRPNRLMRKLHSTSVLLVPQVSLQHLVRLSMAVSNRAAVVSRLESVA